MERVKGCCMYVCMYIIMYGCRFDLIYLCMEYVVFPTLCPYVTLCQSHMPAKKMRISHTLFVGVN